MLKKSKYLKSLLIAAGIFATGVMHQALAFSKELIPNEFVQGFLTKLSDIEKVAYTPEQITLIKEEFDTIRKQRFRSLTPAPTGQRIYVATAGAPGASKSTILEKWLEGKSNFAYLDPDQTTLRYMSLYQNELSALNFSKMSKEDVLKRAYDKWRWASNYISSTLINEAGEKGFNIAHGTTSTPAQITKLYDKLKENGYKITLLLCFTTDENRVAASKNRVNVQGFYQATPEDIEKKGIDLILRVPAYFQYADEMEFYWTDSFDKGSIHAATLHKGQNLTIHDPSAFKKLSDFYDTKRKDNKELPSLDDLIKDYK